MKTEETEANIYKHTYQTKAKKKIMHTQNINRTNNDTQNKMKKKTLHLQFD